jgi:sulfane dehydrogenase subunit SoxC
MIPSAWDGMLRRSGSMQESNLKSRHIDRRKFIALGAAGLGALALRAAEARELGDPRRAYGERSPFERAARIFGASSTPGTGSSRTPLQDLYGTITPSSLHFERHHSGVPKIDPNAHELLVDGLVERPLVFALKQLKRFPAVSRVYFIECAGNSGREHEGRPGENVQRSHGLLSNSEWTGVPLKTVLGEAGIKRKARWIVAEGADASRMSRSIPLEKALDDVLIAYGQNGEALRPEQGYPLRLVVPGWEGNINIKWVDRIMVTDEPFMTREEAAIYTDLMPDGKARWFTFVMEAKSVITRPSGEQVLDRPGFYEISGLAWSGRGRITRVEVSTDAGKTWIDAQLNGPVLAKAATRFSLPWKWDGGEAALQSRCTDENGYVQPTREQLIAVRGLRPGPDGFNHYNGIKTWFVNRDGKVSHV